MIDNSSKVGSCSLDGSYSRTVLYSPSYLRHPFSISVFEVLHLIHLYNHCNIYHWRSQDLMYWTEWDSHRIYEANKFNGANVTTVTTTSLVSKQTTSKSKSLNIVSIIITSNSEAMELNKTIKLPSYRAIANSDCTVHYHPKNPFHNLFPIQII